MSYIYIYIAGFNKRRNRASKEVVRCSKPERTENKTVIKESEVRNLPGTFLFILQNKVNETFCRKVKGGSFARTDTCTFKIYL